MIKALVFSRALFVDMFAKIELDICLRCKQSIYFSLLLEIRYDTNPRSRSEHIELLIAHSCHQ